jgi:hypothetical protein
MVLKQLLTDSQFCAVATQCTIGKKEACCSVWEQYWNHSFCLCQRYRPY